MLTFNVPVNCPGIRVLESSRQHVYLEVTCLKEAQAHIPVLKKFPSLPKGTNLKIIYHHHTMSMVEQIDLNSDETYVLHIDHPNLIFSDALRVCVFNVRPTDPTIHKRVYNPNRVRYHGHNGYECWWSDQPCVKEKAAYMYYSPHPSRSPKFIFNSKGKSCVGFFESELLPKNPHTPSIPNLEMYHPAGVAKMCVWNKEHSLYSIGAMKTCSWVKNVIANSKEAVYPFLKVDDFASLSYTNRPLEAYYTDSNFWLRALRWSPHGLALLLDLYEAPRNAELRVLLSKRDPDIYHVIENPKALQAIGIACSAFMLAKP